MSRYTGIATSLLYFIVIFIIFYLGVLWLVLCFCVGFISSVRQFFVCLWVVWVLLLVFVLLGYFGFVCGDGVCVCVCVGGGLFCGMGVCVWACCGILNDLHVLSYITTFIQTPPSNPPTPKKKQQQKTKK